jgi:hypothetical protein
MTLWSKYVVVFIIFLGSENFMTKTEKMLKNPATGDLFTRITKLLNALEEEGIESLETLGDITTYLFANLGEYDYNMFDLRIIKLKTTADLKALQNDMRLAICGMGFWKKLTCKDCGKVYYLTKEQIDDFMAKDYNLPKRCPKCQKVNRQRKKAAETRNRYYE